MKNKLQIKWRKKMIRNCTMWVNNSQFQYFKTQECPNYFWNVSQNICYSEWIKELSKFTNISPFNKLEQLLSFKYITLLNFKTKGCVLGKERIISGLQYIITKRSLQNMEILLFLPVNFFQEAMPAKITCKIITEPM